MLTPLGLGKRQSDKPALFARRENGLICLWSSSRLVSACGYTGETFPLIVKDRCVSPLLVALVAIISSRHPGAWRCFSGKSAGRRAFNLGADFARRAGCWRPTRACITAFWPAGLAWGCGWGRRGCRWLSFSWPACAGRRDFRRADRQPQNSLYSGAPALLALVAVLTQA